VVATAGRLALEIFPTVKDIGSGIQNQVLRQVQEIGNRAADALSTSLAKGGDQGGQQAGRAIAEEVGKAGARAGQQAGEQIALFTVSGAKRAGTEAGQAVQEGTVSGATAGAQRAGTAIAEGVARGARSGGESAKTALREELASAGTQGASVMSRAFASIRGGITDLSGHVRSMGSTVTSEAEKAGSAVTSKLGGSLSLGTTMMAGLGAGAVMALGQAAAAAVRTGIEFDASQESATMAFTTMLHSGQQATEFMGQLEKFAAQTPFDLPDVVTGAQRLMAFGFEAKQVVPTLTAIGDAVAGMGGSAEQIQQVTLAIGQMSAKGKIQSDEILQLTEAGIPALRILANQMNVSTGDLQNLITKGLVPAGPAIQQLLSGMEQGTKGAAGTTTAFAGMMANQSVTLTGTWSNFKDNFNRAMGQLLQPAMPAIKASLGWLTSQLGKVPAGLHQISVAAGEIGQGFRTGQAQSAGFAGVMERIGVAARNVANWFMTVLWPPLQRIGSLLWTYVQPAWSALVVVFTQHLWPALQRMWTAMSPFVEIFFKVAGVILGVAIVALLKLVEVLFRLAGPVIDILSRAFAGFFNVVRSVFSGLATAGVAVWHALEAAWSGLTTATRAVGTAVGAALRGIQVALSAVGDAAVWLWHNAIQPTWNAISLAARILFAVVFTVLVTPWLILWRTVLGPVITWLWQERIKPIFDLIGLGAQLLWRGIEIVGHGIASAWNFLGGIFRDVYNFTIRVAIEAFQWGMSILHDKFIVPISRAIQIAWQAVGIAWRWVHDTFIQPAITGFQIALSWLHDHVVVPVGNAISNIWRGMGDAINWVWLHVIRPAFDAVSWAVHGVGSAFDSAVNWIGQIWDRIKGVVAVPINFVINTILNNGLFAAWNWIADKIGLGNLKLHVNPIPGYARGGILPGYSPGRDNMLAASPGGPVALSGGEAIMRPEWTAAAGRQYITGANEAAARGGVTGASSFIAANGLPGYFLGGVFDWVGDAANAVGNFASSTFNGVLKLGGEVVDFFKDPPGFAEKVLSKIVGENSNFTGGTDWGKMLLSLPTKAIGAMVDKVKSWFSASSGGGAGGAGGNVNYAPSAGVAQWSSVVVQALGMMAQPGGLLNTVLRRMAQESGGNPNVVNKWDSNWQRGTPSVGLMQVIGPTYASNADPRHNVGPYSYGVSVDPLSNVLASMHYAMGRYGSLAAAFNRAGGYDGGGFIPAGVSTVYNGLNRPEPVLTPTQWTDIHELARRGSTSGGPTVMVNARTDASPEHIAAVTTRKLQIAMRTG
jgi:tape measure domain-containing protein